MTQSDLDRLDLKFFSSLGGGEEKKGRHMPVLAEMILGAP
jgi:hypothetical protein